MQLIYSQEAKAFLSHDHNATNSKRPLLPVFLAKGSHVIGLSNIPGVQKSVATQVMLHVEPGHSKILKMLRPFMFMPVTNPVFDGYEGLRVLESERSYSRHLMPAIDLLVDFDLLVCLIGKYPALVKNVPGLLNEAAQLVVKALSRVHNTERLISSGRLPA